MEGTTLPAADVRGPHTDSGRVLEGHGTDDETLNVVLVGRCLMIRQSVARYLRAISMFRIAGECAQAVDLQALHDTTGPGPVVLLFDTDRADVREIELVAHWVRRLPHGQLVWLASQVQDWWVGQALRIGVRGYVLKTDPLEVLVDVVRRVSKGERRYSRDVELRIVDAEGTGRAGRLRTRLDTLSPRELQILEKIACGLAKRAIAAEMGISIKTVETLTARLMKKLAIHDRVGLARFAFREGLCVP